MSAPTVADLYAVYVETHRRYVEGEVKFSEVKTAWAAWRAAP